MPIYKVKDNKLYQRYIILKKFLHIMGLKPIHILLPVTLSLIAASFDGIGLGLLIPLARGMVAGFEFVKEIPVLKNLLAVFTNLLPVSISTPNKSIFLFLVILIFGSVLLKNIISYIGLTFSAHCHVRFKYKIYKFIFDRYLSFGKLFFDRTSQGYLTTIMDYTEKVMTMFELFEDSVNSLLTLGVYFTIMFVISWKLTMVTIVIFPVLHYSLELTIKKLHDTALLKHASWLELHRNVFNVLSCIPLVKAYSKEEEVKKTYGGILEEMREMDVRTAKLLKLIGPIKEVIINIALLLMVSVVALLLAKDKPAEISVFVVFFYAARKSLPMFNVFNEIKALLAQTRPPLREIAQILDDKDKFFVSEGKEIFNGLKERIDFVHLDFSYIKEVQVLKDINFSIEKGKKTAIVGPSGSGKTTLISLLMRFYDCASSSIMIDGVDIRNFTLKSLREHMALVSQETLLFNDTLRNNMIFGLNRAVSESELIEVSKKTRIYDFIMQLPNGFDTAVGDRGVKLSGGEKQRIAIARALLKGSEIFLLDEAMSSLDSKTENLIQEAINEAIKYRTSIVIAHRLSTIKNVDKIVVIENGRILEQGPLNELLDKRGKFYEYWQAQKF